MGEVVEAQVFVTITHECRKSDTQDKSNMLVKGICKEGGRFFGFIRANNHINLIMCMAN